ncbi:MAG: RNA-binding protein [Verrucomicrobiales bacterium]|jgi:RNA recognition motif-containing protein|nr:RNA-binding protein [Verrucomicrobiales bacterium]
MSNTEQHSGRSSGYRGRRRNNRDRGGRYRGSREAGKTQKKTNPFVAFLGKLFGFGQKSNSRPTANREHAPRVERPERAESPALETQKNEVETPRLYIGNLSYETSESDLFDLFSQVGTVNNVEVVRDGRSNSKGFGFVEMGTLETAKAASEKFHRTDFMGRQIVVAGAKK